MTRVGSLFSGMGGLDLGVQSVLGGTVAWHCETEPAARRVLAHHWAGAPNLGDITAVDWARVEPVDVLTGGFPCQDVSSAGRRTGMQPGTRSGLWSHMAYAISVLRPRLVVVENVRGLLSSDADCDVEPDPWGVGDGAGRPLRALGSVLGDLADLGLDAQWRGLRAADVGAPHGRYRIFIAAWPAADAERGELQRRGVGGVLAGPEGTGAGEGPQRQRDRHPAGDGGAADPDPAGVGRRPEGRHDGVRPSGLVTEPVADTDHGAGHGEWARTEPRQGGSAPADAHCDGFEGRAERHLRSPAGQQAPFGPDAAGCVLDWGDYGPAIRRWELILGRPAPAPTQAGRRGGRQLSPLFVEWLMGLPEGHVTGVPGLSRNEQLKLLGNGVVPAQAAAALSWLLVAATTRDELVAS